MSVRGRLTLAFLAVSLLIPLVGLLAVREQYVASQRAAQIEARHVAEPIAHTIANTGELTGGDRRQLYHDQQRLQQYVDDLQRDLHRHMEVIDLHQRVLAAATPGKEQDEDEAAARQDTDAEVAATIGDGQPRTFIERDQEYPEGTLQVVIPLRSDQGGIVGAVVMEYTPIYRELLAAGADTRRAIVAASVTGLLLGLYGLVPAGELLGRFLSSMRALAPTVLAAGLAIAAATAAQETKGTLRSDPGNG